MVIVEFQTVYGLCELFISAWFHVITEVKELNALFPPKIFVVVGVTISHLPVPVMLHRGCTRYPGSTSGYRGKKTKR